VSHPESTEEKIGQFYDKLCAQSDLYLALLELAKKQAAEATHEDIDALVMLLEEKKRIVEKIEKIEVSAAPLRQIWKRTRTTSAIPAGKN